MRDLDIALAVLQDRGRRHLPLKRVYRLLYNPELYLRAYRKIYRNAGALTPGTDPDDTIDGMSLKRIDRLIADLADDSFEWKPARRIYIPKKNGELRPLGIPSWKDKLLQEAIRIILDAYYEQVREDGQVRDLAVLSAVGVNSAGKREILGVSVSLSEHEVHWRTFLEGLKARGLGGVQLITSDDHAGLRAARLAVFGGIPWQRCQFHLQQNAQAYVPHKDMQAEVAEDIRTIFNAPDRTTAEAYLAKAVEKYQKTASRLAEWMAANIPEGLMVFSFPAAHRRLIRTTNGVERLHREVRRRARVVSIFPNQASCLRLVSAVLNEISDDWVTGRTYISFEGDALSLPKGSK